MSSDTEKAATATACDSYAAYTYVVLSVQMCCRHTAMAADIYGAIETRAFWLLCACNLKCVQYCTQGNMTLLKAVALRDVLTNAVMVKLVISCCCNTDKLIR
jgi:hypothetical protein